MTRLLLEAGSRALECLTFEARRGVIVIRGAPNVNKRFTDVLAIEDGNHPCLQVLLEYGDVVGNINAQPGGHVGS
jgi:hypothetical protein